MKKITKLKIQKKKKKKYIYDYYNTIIYTTNLYLCYILYTNYADS